MFYAIINSFDPTPCKPVKIRQNDDNRHEWDIPENENMVLVEHEGYSYYVQNNANLEHSTKIICFIIKYTKLLKLELCKHFPTNNKLKDNIILFLKTPIQFQEITPNDMFDGLNKPKDIVENKDNLNIVLDNKYRASYRLIMLRIRNKNGSFRQWKVVKKLLIHELTHGMCNHCTYRTKGNHDKDFNECEEFLKKFIKNNKELK